MLIVALVLAVIGLAALVTAVVTGNELIALVCIAASVIGVLLLFLGSARAALLTALTIPLSLLFAFICMYLAGIPANLLSLGAIDFGIVVDGSLVMVEHIVHRLEEREREGRLGDATRAVQAAALEMSRPIFFSCR